MPVRCQMTRISVHYRFERFSSQKMIIIYQQKNLAQYRHSLDFSEEMLRTEFVHLLGSAGQDEGDGGVVYCSVLLWILIMHAEC